MIRNVIKLEVTIVFEKEADLDAPAKLEDRVGRIQGVLACTVDKQYETTDDYDHYGRRIPKATLIQ